MMWFLAAALLGQDGFAAISARSFVAAELNMSNPVVNVLRGVKPEKSALDREQIDAAIAILKRARPEPRTRTSIVSTLVIHFVRSDGVQVHAVIGDPPKPGDSAPIFFAGQQAMLGNTDYAEIQRLVVETGCER